MIVIGPFGLILLALLIFKPVRMVVGWLLFALMCFIVYSCATLPS